MAEEIEDASPEYGGWLRSALDAIGKSDLLSR